MEEAVVLFLHHRADATTHHHYELLKRHNPFPIIPAFCNDGGTVIPLLNSVEITKSYQRGRNWHNGDWILHQWFNSPAMIEAKRYIYIEWDCCVDLPLADWYGDLWNSDAVGSVIEQLPSRWFWFESQYDYLPYEWQKFARGIVPLNGTLLSQHAMQTFGAMQLPEAINAELRLATALAFSGIKLEPMPAQKAIKNVYLPFGRSLQPQTGSFTHPVKTTELSEDQI